MYGVAVESWEERAAESRRVKAGRLAHVLRERGDTVVAVAHFGRTERKVVEQAAGTRKASDATWRIVVEMLAHSARERALCTTCGLGDPEGEPGPRKPAGHEGRCSR